LKRNDAKCSEYLKGLTVMFDHGLHQRLGRAATSLAAAMRTAEGLSCRNSSASDEHLQTLLALLEKAYDDLHAAQSGQPTAYEETLFPTAAMAFAAIERLTNGEGIGFLIRRDGVGRCRVRLWQAPAR
jgi:cell division protein ZapA (FtsZ GTPase activity inhibitor)